MKKKSQPDLCAMLSEDYKRWYDLYENGGSDPNWSDGSNLRLVRNHIIFDKQRIEKAMSPECYPEDYYRDLPPEVPDDYMAKPEKIRLAAKHALQTYLTDKNYLALQDRVKSLHRVNLEKTHVDCCYSFVDYLKKAIEKDDLVYMRVHRNPKRWISSFETGLDRLKGIEPPEEYQLSLFGEQG